MVTGTLLFRNKAKYQIPLFLRGEVNKTLLGLVLILLKDHHFLEGLGKTLFTFLVAW